MARSYVLSWAPTHVSCQPRELFFFLEYQAKAWKNLRTRRMYLGNPLDPLLKYPTNLMEHFRFLSLSEE